MALRGKLLNVTTPGYLLPPVKLLLSHGGTSEAAAAVRTCISSALADSFYWRTCAASPDLAAAEINSLN